MDAGLFIYVPRDQGQNMYFKVFNGQDNPPPPSAQNQHCSSPKKTRDQFQSFPISTDCHANHIAVFHGLWPSVLKVVRN